MDSAPRLPSRNDPTDYAPYSITAVLALVAACVFLVILLLLGGSALIGGTQLIEPLLLIMPAGILVLTFAARRQINHSEGTRVGLNLCTIAWWIAILGGFSYLAYLAGRMIGVRQDAKTAIQEWFDVLEKANPLDMRSEEFHRAYQMTLPTGRQQSLDAKTPAEREEKQRGFRDDTQEMSGTIRFRQSDVIRLAYRNRDFSPKFTFDGLQTWEQDASGMMCKAAATLRTPEGEANIVVTMHRQVTENLRPIWRIVTPQQGVVVSGRVTPYGQMVIDLENSSRLFVNQSFLASCLSPNLRNQILTKLAEPSNDVYTGLKMYRDEIAGMSVGGGAVLAKAPRADHERFVKRDFFVPLGADATKDDSREKFYSVWQEGRIVPPGIILAETPDQAPLMTITEKSVEVRIPVELQLPRMESSQSAARGWVVLVCDDTQTIGQLNELRKSASRDSMTNPVMQSAPKPFPWKVKAIESDLKHVTMPKRADPMGGGGGGMPGMH